MYLWLRDANDWCLTLVFMEEVVNNTCPVTGKVCNRPAVFEIVETLGDKNTNTRCCRECACHAIMQRNAIAGLAKAPQQGLTVITASQLTQQKRCPSCSWDLEKILALNSVGCTECFSFFEKELKLHGRAAKKKDPENTPPKTEEVVVNPDSVNAQRIEALKLAMEKATEKEDYHTAAFCRDEIKRLQEEEEKDKS